MGIDLPSDPNSPSFTGNDVECRCGEEPKPNDDVDFFLRDNKWHKILTGTVTASGNGIFSTPGKVHRLGGRISIPAVFPAHRPPGIYSLRKLPDYIFLNTQSPSEYLRSIKKPCLAVLTSHFLEKKLDMYIKKFILSFIIFCGVCFAGLFYISTLFDFDAMEGRGTQRKNNVKWAFKHGSSFEGVSDYLLLQSYDQIRSYPRLNVQAQYWLSNGGYLELYDLNPVSFSGEKCLSFSIESYRLMCSINGVKPEPVCLTSFLNQINILSPTPSLNEIIDKYDSIKVFYQSYPSRHQGGKYYQGTDIPRPLQKYRQTYSDTEITCWVETEDKDISKPTIFECDEQYHKCKASSSIKIVK